MTTFNFKKIFSAFDTIKLSPTEKNSIRLNVARHMHQNPIGSKRPSVVMFRYALTAALVCVMMIGSGGIVAFASQASLPGKILYPVKRATENIKKLTLNDSSKKATYELALIEKRFDEVNELISKQQLTKENESIAIAAIAEHTSDLKIETSQLAIANPVAALSYNTQLANTLKTGTHVLLALSEKESLKEMTSQPSGNTLVLAAYESASKLSIETKQLEQMVLSDTNIATIKTAEKRYTETLALLEKNNISIPKESSDEIITTPTTVSTDVIVKPITTTKPVSEIIPVSGKTTVSPKATVIISPILSESNESIATLVVNIQKAYNDKKYGQVIILADQIEQKLSESVKIKQAEKTYNIVVPDLTESVIPTTEAVSSVPSEVQSVEIIAANQLKK
jgi:hypothetical protein